MSLVPVSEALARMLEGLEPVGTERVRIEDAGGRVLAEALRAKEDLPPWRTSAVDGYALAAASLAAIPIELPVVDRVTAGRMPSRAVGAGEAAQVMTGAPVPDGADAIVMVEQCEPLAGDRVRVRARAEPGENLRHAGEAMRRGETVLEPGIALTPARIALAAAAGHAELVVRRRVRAAVLSTGDELAPPGSRPRPGQIYDSNRYGLLAALREFGAEAIDLGVASDDAGDFERRLDGAADADLLVTSGGVSMGERDVVKEVLARRGGVEFITVAMRPGKPQAFGRVGRAAFFGLPGNPVSSMVVFELFVRPALRLLAGYRVLARTPLRARLEETFSKKAGLAHFLRAVVRAEGAGFAARLTGPQGSHVVRSMAEANALLHIPAETTRVAAGDEVEFTFLREPIAE